MDFDTEYWVRSILVSHMGLEKNVKIIDKRIEYHVFAGGDTLSLFDEIIRLTERKRRIVALRVIVTEMLNSLTPKRRALLGDRYIYEKTCAEAAEEAGISLRQYFPAHDAAIKECAEYLTERGCTAQWFGRYYGGEAWITDPLNRRGFTGILARLPEAAVPETNSLC